ncbi:MAG: replicative DNA helicase [Pseudomonadales bacterium]|nr:replicative DNA helicase [Pseudomonadales bacterium]
MAISEFPRAVPRDRQVPHDLDAEMAVLGSLMTCGEFEAWDLLQDALQEEDFFLPEHRTLFGAFARLAERAAQMNRIAVLDELRSHGEVDKAGGPDYLAIVESSTVGWRGVRGHAKIVASLATRRRLIRVANDIQSMAFEPGDLTPDQLLQRADQELLKIAADRLTGDEPVDVTTLLQAAVQRVRDIHEQPGLLTGAPTGWKALDNMTSGFQPGDLVVLAARPAMGKTAMALNIAEQLVMRDAAKPVLFFSLEQPREQLALRLISSLGRIDLSKLRNGYYHVEDQARVGHAATLMADKPLYFDDSSLATPNYVRTRARRIWREQGGLALIVVDYLQLMTSAGKHETRTLEISSLTRDLKSIARELEVPVLALAQLNRDLEKRTDRRPRLADLRESGSIEQDADIVMFIYRDEVYNPNSRDKGIAELSLAKQRNGPIGKVILSFVKEITKFEPAPDEYGELGDDEGDNMALDDQI